jgi:hypothetical protein
MCLAALNCAAVPSVFASARPWYVGLIQRVGPAYVAGATMAYDAYETLTPRCPKDPPRKWVSIAGAFAWSNFRMA